MGFYEYFQTMLVFNFENNVFYLITNEIVKTNKL